MSVTLDEAIDRIVREIRVDVTYIHEQQAARLRLKQALREFAKAVTALPPPEGH